MLNVEWGVLGRHPAFLMAITLGLVLGAAPAFAQQIGPPGPYVLDVRGATMGLPDAAEFFPPVTAAALIPGRAFGLDAGAHVYVASLGPARVGLGADLLWLRGTTASQEIQVASGSSAIVNVGPAIHMTVKSLVPQVSFNFGSRGGWSYLSGGMGRATIVTTTIPSTGEQTARLSGPLNAISVGGGARWFVTPRLGVGFDIRMHKFAPGKATPGATVLSVSVGFSLR